MDPSSTYRIVPAEGGRLMIRRDDGTAVLGNQDYPDELVALSTLHELARSHGLEMVVRYRPDGHVDRVIIGPDLATEPPTVEVKVSLPTVLNDAVDEMAAALYVSRDEVIRRAITLLKVAFDAEGESHRLAILTPDDEIVRDIVGVRPVSRGMGTPSHPQ